MLGLAHGDEDHDVEIIPFPPGNVESYDLESSGKVTLCERVEFHSFEKKPKWADIPAAVKLGK